MTESGLAERWLAVRQTSSRIRFARLRNWLLLVVDFLSAGNADPTYSTDCYRVLLVRRDTGDEVLAFEHEDRASASQHVSSLEERLGTLSYFDFCRDVGIPFDTAITVMPRP